MSDNKRASGCVHKNKMTDEDVFCIECAPIDPPKQSSSSEIEKPIDQPKLRSSSEIENCEYLSSISCLEYAQCHSTIYEAISLFNTGNNPSDKPFDNLK